MLSRGRQMWTYKGVVSRARLTRAERKSESGQIPITVSCLTRQEFLGVLIGYSKDVMSKHAGGASPADCQCYYTHVPIMFAPT